MKMSLSPLYAGVLLVLSGPGCQDQGSAPVSPPAPTTVWSKSGDLTMYSSPRLADLDGDGVLDVIVGHGLPGDDASGAGAAGYVTARSGVDGHELWRGEATQELFATPLLVRINGDEVPDVIIGGRRAELRARDGLTGAEIWRYVPDPDPMKPGGSQFFTGQLIGDQDSDGVEDLLFANGGFPAAGPGEPRPPSHLVIIGGADGGLMAAAEMPDAAETYMSALTYTRRGEPTVVFGSGGETLPGSLWVAPLSAVAAGDLSGAVRLTRPVGWGGAGGACPAAPSEGAAPAAPDCSGKGVIAPPALVDLTGDGTLDIVVATFDGQLAAFDGDSLAALWSLRVPGAETYATPAIGYFDDDEVPDVYAVFDIGAFPDYSSAEHRVVSGASGRLLWSFSDARVSYSSPVAVDLGGDRRDEVLLLLMDAPTDSDEEIDEDVVGERAALYMMDIPARRIAPVQAIDGFAASTPALGDIDGDGTLDLVLGTSVYGEFSAGWVMARLSLGVPAPARLGWGGYLGSQHDGRFIPR
ncbi:MAG: VCBS repeat-containing protein [Deltaproteobacteria bacterium]|nr:VCBS repeat-containing protein [Deltaproteobacteria bacterium]MCB9787563.1 VCBS repeat-containing protein [Deltaproteobacteria bacterium]